MILSPVCSSSKGTSPKPHPYLRFTLVVLMSSRCNNDTAQIILSNAATGDEYYCTDVNTVPDNTSQVSTCPIMKNQLTNGTWIIIETGNNGNGNPFNAQRQFNLTVGTQATVTTTNTVTISATTTPTTTSTGLNTYHASLLAQC
jgi:hypothetical protein